MKAEVIRMVFITILSLGLLACEFFIMYVLINDINERSYFHYGNRNIWIIIVVFGNVFGQILYLLLEKNAS